MSPLRPSTGRLTATALVIGLLGGPEAALAGGLSGPTTQSVSGTVTAAQGTPGAIPWPVSSPIPATIVTGQVKIATTGTPVQLPSNALLNGLVIKAKATNVANAFVGSAGVTTTYDGTGTGYPIEPGAAASFATLNSNAVYVNGTAGDVFSFEGN